MSTIAIKRGLAALLLAGFATSLVLPVAVSGPGMAGVWPGWSILMIGWLGVLILQVGWFGNVLLIPTIVLLLIRDRPPRWLAIGVAVGLILCALDALAWANIPGDNSDGPIIAYRSGYYLWLATIVLAAIAAAATGWPYRRTNDAARRTVETGQSSPANFRGDER